MNYRVHGILVVFAAVFFFVAALAYAATSLNPAMQSVVDGYKKDAGVQAFDAEAGRRLFTGKRVHSKGDTRSCTTCHTDNPAARGKTPVGKVIEPISPAVNSKRFTDPKKVEKWFRRNCKWVLERECTPEEKGNYISFMMSL